MMFYHVTVVKKEICGDNHGNCNLLQHWILYVMVFVYVFEKQTVDGNAEQSDRLLDSNKRIFKNPHAWLTISQILGVL